MMAFETTKGGFSLFEPAEKCSGFKDKAVLDLLIIHNSASSANGARAM